jgi:hypothetical protein
LAASQFSRHGRNEVDYMKSFVVKMLIAVFGLTLVTAPLTASAQQWGVRVGFGGPGYVVHAGYRDGRRRGYDHRGYYGYRPGWYPRPVSVAPYYGEGYYGWAPGGYYGYYHHGRWFSHRRWGGGAWFYF